MKERKESNEVCDFLMLLLQLWSEGLLLLVLLFLSLFSLSLFSLSLLSLSLLSLSSLSSSLLLFLL